VIENEDVRVPLLGDGDPVPPVVVDTGPQLDVHVALWLLVLISFMKITVYNFQLVNGFFGSRLSPEKKLQFGQMKFFSQLTHIFFSNLSKSDLRTISIFLSLEKIEGQFKIIERTLK
jgi:hypothetical protein